MMPGERYEVIIDFGLFAGKNLILQNTARTPYVGGAPVNGQTTGRIMQFRVATAVVGVIDKSFNPATPGAFIRAKVDPVTNKMVPNPMVRLSATLGRPLRPA